MNITREDMPGRQVALTIELEPEVVNDALDRAYRQMVNQVNIPGFRRGKAPRYMVERYMGAEALTERAVRNILPQTVQDAITEQNIEALDVGEVDIVSMDPLQVKVIVVQPPIVELGNYSHIRVEKETTEVTPEQVEEVLNELRRDGAPWNEVTDERPIKEGDMVYVDLEGFSSEGEMPEAKRENFPTLVGMKRAGVPDAVNEALAGMKVGEEKDVTETLPDDFPTEEMRGKDVSYHVKVLQVKEQQLNEINDEFAKTLGFDTTELLRETVDKNLRQRMEETAESNQVNKAIEQLVEGANVEVPELLVKEEVDAMLKSLENRLKDQRLTLRQYFTFNGMNEDEWRASNHDRAQERVIRGLVLQEFAHNEGISVDDEEITGEIDTILESYEGQDKEQARNVLTNREAQRDLQDRIYQRKLVDRLTGIAEGRIEAAPPHVHEHDHGEEAEAAPEEAAPKPKARKSAKAATAQSDEADATADATALEEAGGAAEILGTGDVDLNSPNETGDAPGGGTPSTAPQLEAQSDNA